MWYAGKEGCKREKKTNNIIFMTAMSTAVVN
jgi:hypothetical protein